MKKLEDYTQEEIEEIENAVLKSQEWIQKTAEEAFLKHLYPKWNCPKCKDWFHLPYKECKCHE